MNFYAFAVGILFIFIQGETVYGQCPSNKWKRVGNLCYYIDQTNQLTWLAAKERCNSMDATLPILDSVAVNNGLGNELVTLGASTVFWIGLYDQGHEGTYTWLGSGLSTNQVGFSNWATSNPKSGNTTNCATTGAGSIKNQWQNQACSTLTNYVCQRPLDNAASGIVSCKTTVPAKLGKCPRHLAWVTVATSAYTCYYLNYTTRLNFIEAQEACAQKGMTLATFATEELWSTFVLEMKVVVPFILGYDFWIGLYDQGHENHWYWNPTSETDLAYTTAWNDEQPGYDTTKNCAYMDGSSSADNYLWTTGACSKALRFVCELPAQCIL